MSPEFVSTAEAAALLGSPRNYALVHWLCSKGVLKQIEQSERKRFYKRAEVMRVARERQKDVAVKNAV